MYQITFLPVAKNDIDAAISYLVDNLNAYQAAMALADALDGTLDLLAKFPYSNPVYFSELPLKDEIRKVPVKGYVLYYAVFPEQERVEIRRFLHGRRKRDDGDIMQS